METSAANLGNRRPAEPSTIEELAALQGVTPVTEFGSLLGLLSPDDETDEEFAAMLREWRSEGSTQKPRR